MPQPVDIQTEVARVTAAERMQQITDRVSLVAQQRLALAEQETHVVAETVVNQTQPKETEVDTEARRRNPFVGRRRKRGESRQQNAEQPEAPGHKGHADLESHHFDVTV